VIRLNKNEIVIVAIIRKPEARYLTGGLI